MNDYGSPQIERDIVYPYDELVVKWRPTLETLLGCQERIRERGLVRVLQSDYGSKRASLYWWRVGLMFSVSLRKESKTGRKTSTCWRARAWGRSGGGVSKLERYVDRDR